MRVNTKCIYTTQQLKLTKHSQRMIHLLVILQPYRTVLANIHSYKSYAEKSCYWPCTNSLWWWRPCNMLESSLCLRIARSLKNQKQGTVDHIFICAACRQGHNDMVDSSLERIPRLSAFVPSGQMNMPCWLSLKWTLQLSVINPLLSVWRWTPLLMRANTQKCPQQNTP